MVEQQQPRTEKEKDAFWGAIEVHRINRETGATDATFPDAFAQTSAALGLTTKSQGSVTPAVPIEESVTDEAITCLECGKPFKSIKRHLSTHHSLTPEQYRAKWGLPGDYPVTAPVYSATRSELAKSSGLGRKS